MPFAVDVETEVDYYNVRENRLRIFARDLYKCRYCRKQLTRFTATLDHVTPVSAGDLIPVLILRSAPELVEGARLEG